MSIQWEPDTGSTDAGTRYELSFIVTPREDPA